ncbi:MAG: acuA [Bacillales bacterium]|nr:acuA [Bacillales bacterium]
MLHRKNFNSLEHLVNDEILIIKGPVDSNELETFNFDSELSSFRPAPQQKLALVEIAQLPEGRIIVALKDNLVVGYVTYLYPDPLERWYEGQNERLIELGAIEVIPNYRNSAVGKKLLEVSFMDEVMEEYIIFTTEYYWHWDLKGTGLNLWEYRKAMEKMMNSVGLTWMATDDPEICSHPANCLMVRIGSKVDRDSIEKFDKVRFQGRFMY